MPDKSGDKSNRQLYVHIYIYIYICIWPSTINDNFPQPLPKHTDLGTNLYTALSSQRFFDVEHSSKARFGDFWVFYVCGSLYYGVVDSISCMFTDVTCLRVLKQPNRREEKSTQSGSICLSLAFVLTRCNDIRS